MADFKKVAILTGGDSPEKEISLKTARSVEGSLKRMGIYNEIIPAEGDFAGRLQDGFDIVFIAMHGGMGENGSIQGLLQTLGLTYTGSGVLSSAVCMNKPVSKKLLRFCGIKTPRWQVLNSCDELEIELPVVFKPSEGGSTIGTVIVRKKELLKKAFAEVSEASLGFGGEVMAEEYIPGREITVGVLRGKALPLLEIKPGTEFYDYRAKYTEGMSEHFEPEDLSPALKKEIRDTAEKSFRAAQCRDMARVDFRLNGEDFYVLEINTIPGMTSTSLLPEAAGIAGIDFDGLVMEILKSAGLRAQKRPV